jgi:hypothetical protein
MRAITWNKRFRRGEGYLQQYVVERPFPPLNREVL